VQQHTHWQKPSNADLTAKFYIKIILWTTIVFIIMKATAINSLGNTSYCFPKWA